MEKKSELPTLKALLNKSSHKDKLLHLFSPSRRETLESFPNPFKSTLSFVLNYRDWCQKIHYSWFYEALKNEPTALQKVFLSLVQQEQGEKAAELLKVSFKGKEFSSFAACFLMEQLKKRMQKEEILPQELLPESDLNALLDLSKKELTHVIDLLGIYDLACDLRQIVDKDLLGKIHNALGRERLQFLHFATRQTIKWASPKLNLERWDGTKKSLDYLLHQRGLIRLGKALYNEHPDFKWHLLHLLDIGRAHFMEKTLSQKLDPALISYFKRQVLHIIERYRT